MMNLAFVEHMEGRTAQTWASSVSAVGMADL